MLVRRGSGTRKLKFRRGDVYTLGSLTGLWAGRMLVGIRSVFQNHSLNCCISRFQTNKLLVNF
ncbi:hypothetical protein ARMSODRAFT_967268, partial [Armillaria solidipes]